MNPHLRCLRCLVSAVSVVPTVPDNDDVPDVPAEEFLRLPGLFRRWELEQVLEAGADFHLEEAGTTSDGTPLFALCRRERRNTTNPNHKEQ